MLNAHGCNGQRVAIDSTDSRVIIEAWMSQREWVTHKDKILVLLIVDNQITADKNSKLSNRFKH